MIVPTKEVGLGEDGTDSGTGREEGGSAKGAVDEPAREVGDAEECEDNRTTEGEAATCDAGGNAGDGGQVGGRVAVATSDGQSENVGIPRGATIPTPADRGNPKSG